MRRRDFLKLAGLAPLGLACSAEDALPPVVTPDAGPWGQPPSGFEDLVLPQAMRPEGTLEVFCLGGLSAWETFYTVPEFGTAGSEHPNQQMWAFPAGLTEWRQKCAPDLPDPLWVPYGVDGVGRTINLGPFAYALRDRPDMLARMRVWVMQHHLEPHEIAIPLAITGHSVGNPRMAALGSHLHRYVLEREPGRQLPVSYQIFLSSFDRTNNAPAFTTTGLHPSWARPLAVQLGGGQRLSDQLLRPGSAGFSSDLDALTGHYLDRARRLLTGPGASAAVRSQGLSEFAVSREALGRAELLRSLLPGELLSGRDVDPCVPPLVGAGPQVPDETTAAMELARHLLTNPIEKARYVNLLEGGLLTDRVGQGYDSHGEHVAMQGTNVAHMLRALSDIVARPGEKAPHKLDLDRHFVLLNTEFGRAPYPEYSPRNPNGGGTNHWPWGYVVIGFGAFVGPQQAGVVGAIGGNGYATEGLTPAEHRAAMMLAHGVWPFTTESYAVGDVRGAESEPEAAQLLLQRVLGYGA